MSSQNFTPEDKLELLFDPKLIPSDVKDALPDHLQVCIGHPVGKVSSDELTDPPPFTDGLRTRSSLRPRHSNANT